MPQIFSRVADTVVRFGILGVGVGTFAAALIARGLSGSSYQTQVGWVQDQPVPFSHEHHVGGLGIDCRYCHTGVETSPRAGLPPTHVCMTCHSQLWTGADVLAPVRQSLASGQPLKWNRVAQLPDYVYFNHSVHVARGVPCVECHGRVDKMPLTWRAKPFQMQFCLDCHRDPAPRLRPPSQVTQMELPHWSEEMHRTFGNAQIRRLHIERGRMDNCELCHR